MGKAFGPEQRKWLLHWMAHFYRGCLNRRPERGLAIFLAGPTNSGKTFFNMAILGRLFAKTTDVSNFLTGSDQFNDDMFKSPIATMDDPTSITDRVKNRVFTNKLKLVVANDTLTYRAMYEAGKKMPYLGRLSITMNDDAESIQGLPHDDPSVMDKIALIKVDRPDVDWDALTDEKLLDELSHLAAYLRDMPIDKSIWVGGRFGIQPWHHPYLVELAREQSDDHPVWEILTGWIKEWRKLPENKGTTFWEGLCSDIPKAIGMLPNGTKTYDQLHRQCRNAHQLSIALRKLLGRECPGITFRRSNGNKLWRFDYSEFLREEKTTKKGKTQ